MTSAFEFDAFISYNRNDREFASRLERDVEHFAVPKELGTNRRRLKLFRDTDDMTGTDYEKAIRRHLDGSQKLIVVCSPNARKSSYVNEEINYFIEGHSPEAVVPVMLEGVPNNETDDESLYTFPPALEEAMGMPLGIDYRSWTAGSLSKRQFRDQWYTLLAELLDTSRDKIEQRDRRRKAVRWRVGLGLAAIVLSVTGFLAERWWSTRVEADAATALQVAVGKADIRERAIALSQLQSSPEPRGTLQALLANAEAISRITPEQVHGGAAEARWDERDTRASVSEDIRPLLANALKPECKFEQPPERPLTGVISPDRTLEVYLYQDRLFIQRTDGYGVAPVYCLKFAGHHDTSPGTERWRKGSDTLDGRIGFFDGPDGPEVIVKDVNQFTLHTVPAYRPGAEFLLLANVENAEFGSDGDLLVTHPGQSARRVKLPASQPANSNEEKPDCFTYKGSEKPLADILAAQGHPGFEGSIAESYSEIRGCYLDDRRVIAMVSQQMYPMKVLALSLSDLGRLFEASTYLPDCTVFGRRSLTFCETADATNGEYTKEAWVVRFDANSVERIPLNDENWRTSMDGVGVSSTDGGKLLIWAKPPLGDPDDSPANVWLDDVEDRPPFLIDMYPARIKQAAFSPDGQYLFILREDGTLKLWSFDTEALLTELAERVADLAP